MIRCVLLAACTLLVSCGEREPQTMTHSLVKETQHGSLRGAWADPSRDVQVFRGIPFAEPPVGELRWRPPAPLSSWTGTRSAETLADAC